MIVLFLCIFFNFVKKNDCSFCAFKKKFSFKNIRKTCLLQFFPDQQNKKRKKKTKKKNSYFQLRKAPSKQLKYWTRLVISLRL